MGLRFALLALIARAPLHGYAAHRALEESFGDVVDLNYGRVYQVLRSLEDEGLAVGEERREGRRPLRRVYSASPLGREALEEWLRSAGGRGEPLTEEFFLRLLVGRERGEDPRAWVAAERARVASLLRLADGGSAEGAGQATAVPDLVALWRRLRARADLDALDACLGMLARSGTVARRPSTASRPASGG
ncbi:MAG: PadR family transcriptional regulator [Alphaproteobacteria bacterium]